MRGKEIVMGRFRQWAVLLAGVVLIAGSGLIASASTSVAGATSVKTIKVGMLGVESGPEVVFEGLQQGYDDYLGMINSTGGVNGYKFKTTVYDTGFSTTGEVLGTKNFINSKQFLIAGSESAAPSEIAQLVDAAKVPLIGFSTDPVLVTNTSSKWTTAGNIDYTSLGEFEVEQLAKMGYKQIAFVYIGISTGIDTLAGAEHEAIALGVTLDPIEIPFTQTDFTPIVQRLQSDGDTAVAMVMLDTQAAAIESAAATINYKPQFWVEQAGVDNTFLQNAGTAADGTYADMDVDLPSTSSSQYQLFEKTLTKDGNANAISPLGEQGWTIAAVTVEGVKIATANGKKLTQAGLMYALTHLNLKGSVGFASGIKDSPTQRSFFSGSYIYKDVNGQWTSDNTLYPVPGSLHLSS